MHVWNLAILLIFMLLAACAKTTTERIVVVPLPNSCQITEVRPSALSTIVLGICWDQDGNPIGMAGASGQAVASIPLAVLRAGAMVGGALILGSYMDGVVTGVPE